MIGLVARRGRTEQALESLAALEQEPAAHVAELRSALNHPSGVVVARAARIALRARLEALEPDLARTLVRLCDAPASADPGCVAKKALAEALDRLEHLDAGPFQRGLRLVQREPVFGGSVDTAAELRVACAFALTRIAPAGLAGDLAELLADPEPAARAGAARALAACGGEAAEALLRMRLRLGDAEPAVLGECLLALLRSAPGPGLAAAETMLGSREDDVVEAAASALAESRSAQAVAPLRRLFESGGRRRDVALRALALLRREEAFALLLAIIREGEPRDAIAAATALAPQATDLSLRERLVVAASDREPEVRAALRGLARVAPDGQE